MEHLYAIAYRSKAARELTSQELDRLLLDARTFNQRASVTGVLLYHDGSFFQFFEGPEEGVDAVYQRIRPARTHTNIVELLRAPSRSRQFESWHMGFCETPETELQTLATASWEEAMPITRVSYERSEGLGLLLNYWNKWKAEPHPSI
ncbi:BLUF domain-containing protein [Lysobacter sp. HDW10]|uniref:BLUF domain-containing protein n=1 Tax=Lysobacter sp. HDW10 TaxID=2714936 RepID=UPI001408B26E|nr:BLUF domain-containing protein [Lysobacter sp. HDW10]QIK80640.1 BLUF domain-containing protein [Lysobacter sp. HDW10]